MKTTGFLIALSCAVFAGGAALAADAPAKRGLILVTLPSAEPGGAPRYVYTMAPIVNAEHDQATPLVGVTSPMPSVVPVPKSAPVSAAVPAQASDSAIKPLVDVVDGAVRPIKKIYWFLGGR